jgi:hypothetical protein
MAGKERSRNSGRGGRGKKAGEESERERQEGEKERRGSGRTSAPPNQTFFPSSLPVSHSGFFCALLVFGPFSLLRFLSPGRLGSSAWLPW